MDTNLILKYRKECMGFAIILIVLCHTLYPETEFFLSFQRITQVGVDIFFFLSGLGLYSSYFHNPSEIAFYKKRLKRILPSYLFVVIVYSVFCLITSFDTFTELLYDYSLITFFTSARTAEWFLASILLLYLLFPLIYSLIENDRAVKILIPAIIVLSLVISLLKSISGDVKVINELFFVRVPVFLCGVYFGKKQIKEKKVIRVNGVVTFFVFLVSVVLCIVNIRFNTRNMWWVIRILLLPMSLSLLVLVSSLFGILKVGLIRKLFGFFGTITLELYLIHEKVQTIVFAYFSDTGRLSYGLCIVLTVSVSIILSFVVSFIMSRLTGRNREVKS